MMDAGRAGRVAEIFAAASELGPADRPAFLDRECGGDESIRAEVLDLLDQDDRADLEDFLGARTRPVEPGGVGGVPVGLSGRYEDLREPRPGGMGVVYKARDVELGREVAYKVMNDSQGDADEFRRRFAREAEITATLQYPGIVPVFGMVTDGSGRPAYAMGYVEGADFRELVRTPGAARERLASFLAACRIVEHAHKKGFVHGDLSLKNLMMADDGATHVVDWGLARRLGSADRAGGSPSPSPASREPFTPAFAAPSVRKGGPRTCSTDVYSLGAVLAALVLGLKADVGPDLDGPASKDAPRPLRAIIRAAMADREDGPYKNAGALADDLARYLDGDKVAVDREPPRERAWRLARRHPALTTVAVSTILLLSIASTSAALVVAARENVARKVVEARRARELMLEQLVVAATMRCSSIQADVWEKNSLGNDQFLGALLLGIQWTPNVTPQVRARAAEMGVKLKEAVRDLQAARKRDLVRNQQTVELGLQKTIFRLEGMVTEFPDRRDLIDTLATCQIVQGFYEANLKSSSPSDSTSLADLFKAMSPDRARLDTALAWIDKGLKTLGESSVDPATSQILRTYLNFGWELRAIVLGHAKRFTEGAMAYDRAIAFADAPQATMLKVMRLAILLAAEAEQAKMPWSKGAKVDHALAIRMADYLAKEPDVSPAAVFNAACAFSLASVAQGAIAGERERRAVRAVAFLARIEEKGYFQDQAKAKELDTDPDLNPLRSRDDFRALAARVAKKPG